MELKDIDNEFVNNLNNKKNNKFLDIKKRKQSKKTAIDYFKKINSDGDYYLGIFAKNKLTGTITLRHKEIKSAHIGFLIFQNKKNEVNFSYKVIKSLIKYIIQKKYSRIILRGLAKKSLSNFLLTARFKLKKEG